VFAYVGKGFSGSVNQIVFGTKDRMHKIVLFLHEQYAASHRLHRKTTALFKLGLMMEMLRHKSETAKFQKQVQGSVFREVLHLLLQGLSLRDLVPTSCFLLRHLCDSAMSSHLEELRKHFGLLVTALVPLVDGGRTEARQLLEYLIVKKADLFREQISQLDPLPPQNPEFGEMREVQGQYAGQLTLSQQLEKFASSRSSGSRIALRHLFSLLESKRDQLGLLADESPVILGRLAWALIKLCSGSHDDNNREILLLAAACLGELGNVELREDANFARSVDVDHVFVVEEIVRQLYVFLVDNNVAVIGAASTCMRKLLETAEGGQAFRNLQRTPQGADICEHLYSFRPMPKHQQEQQQQPEQQFSQSRMLFLLPEAVLWRSGNKSFSDWVRPLAAGLCRAVTDDKTLCFGIAAPVCALKVSLAEFLFPFAVRALAQEKDQLNLPSLKEALESVLRDADASSESVQLVLKFSVYIYFVFVFFLNAFYERVFFLSFCCFVLFVSFAFSKVHDFAAYSSLEEGSRLAERVGCFTSCAPMFVVCFVAFVFGTSLRD
jgi:hypothetical protein